MLLGALQQGWVAKPGRSDQWPFHSENDVLSYYATHSFRDCLYFFWIRFFDHFLFRSIFRSQFRWHVIFIHIFWKRLGLLLSCGLLTCVCVFFFLGGEGEGGLLAVVRTVLGNRVCAPFRASFCPSILLCVLLPIHPSLRPSAQPTFCARVFSELYNWFFLNFVLMLETHMKLCVTESDYLENFFYPKVREISPKWVQNRV